MWLFIVPMWLFVVPMWLLLPSDVCKNHRDRRRLSMYFVTTESASIAYLTSVHPPNVRRGERFQVGTYMDSRRRSR